MKKILTSLFVIGVVSVATIGATMAWFTDTGQVSGNTVSTGNFEVNVTQDPLTVENLGPAPVDEDSYFSAGRFAVSNVGDYDMKWRGYLDLSGGGGGIVDYIRVKVEMLPHGGIGDGQGVNCNYGPDDVTVLFSGVSLGDLESYSDYLLLEDPDDSFKPGDAACYEVFVRMEPDAPNDVQNKTLDATLNIEATQWENPDWTETD